VVKRPETLNRDSAIEFNCSCGECHSKTFRMLHKHGAYCKGCQRRITSAKTSEIRTKWTPEAQRDAVDKLMEILKFACLADWYNATQAVFNDNGLSGLIVGRYGGSPSKLLMAVYPEYPWNLILFKTKPQGFWQNPANARLGIEHVMKEKGWTSTIDLHNISRGDIEKNCSGLWDMFSSIIGVLKYAFPEYEWQAIHLRTITKGTFDDFENHRKVIHDLEAELGIKEPMEWFDHISCYLFVSHGYGNLLKVHYDHSPSKLIFTVYPELHKKVHLLGRVPKGCYDDPSMIKMMMAGFLAEMGITSPEGCYNISCMDIQNYFGTGLERRGGVDNGFGGLANFIMEFVEVPPGFVWDRTKFIKRKTEGKVAAHLDAIGIPHTTQSTHPWLRCGVRATYRFDEELMGINTMLELDGPQHFEQIWEWGHPDETRTSDVIKMLRASANGFSGIRLYQPHVFDDSINWKGFLRQALQVIKDSPVPVWVFPKNNAYAKHIELCSDQGIRVIVLE